MLFRLLLIFSFSTWAIAGNGIISQQSESLGFYSNGKLAQAVKFTSDEDYLLLLFPRRDRHYANQVLIKLVEESFKKYKDINPSSERLQIGEVAARFGGHLSGHNSHQNGLDLDAIYLRSDLTEDEVDRPYGYRESFVEAGRVTENFDIARNWELFKIFVATGQVGRIFVDLAIKKEMCAYATIMGELYSETETLRALRPWPNHDDHFHLRILCPADNTRCQAQTPPPPGPGCDDLEMIDESFAP